MIKLIADFAVPITAASILLIGYLRGVDVFDEFLEGAKSGIDTSFDILFGREAIMLHIPR